MFVEIIKNVFLVVYGLFMLFWGFLQGEKKLKT